VRTVPLETAKALKENGFPQETYFHWFPFDKGIHKWQVVGGLSKNTIKGWKYHEKHNSDFSFYSAPSTDELLEQFPWRINYNRNPSDLMITRGPKNFTVRYVNAFKVPFRSTPEKGFVNESLPECLAEMWLYLKQQNLIK